MKHEQSKDIIVDYINGHLSDEQLKKFDSELSRDPDLQREVNEAKDWQSQLHDAEMDVPTPQFSSIEGKLKQGVGYYWRYGLSTAAAVALVAVLLIGNGKAPNNEFETLTNTSSPYDEPVIQIVLSDNSSKTEFAQEYGLRILKTYPNTQIIDVQLTPILEERLTTLATDERTVLIKKIGEN